MLRYRTFELIGNHDLTSAVPPGELSSVQREFVQRNLRRRGDTFRFDAGNYHYSWNWPITTPPAGARHGRGP